MDSAAMARELVLDELFDLTLYKELMKTSKGDLRKILGELVPVEGRHLAFWQEFFKLDLNRLDWGRRAKLRLIVVACRVFGPTAVHLVLEAIEIHGIRKYLTLWELYRTQPMGAAVKEILEDEFRHEDAIVEQSSRRKIDPERIRGIFLGFNDGLVEILGAVSGFFASLRSPSLVLLAGSSVAVAGALSMAAGAYVASSSEREIERTESGKARFLGQTGGESVSTTGSLASGVLVGVSYFVGALVPILPVALGSHSLVSSLLVAGVVIILVSTVLGFLSGMAIRKRVVTNLAILAAAVAITYGIGLIAKRVWGIEV